MRNHIAAAALLLLLALSGCGSAKEPPAQDGKACVAQTSRYATTNSVRRPCALANLEKKLGRQPFDTAALPDLP